MSNLISRLKILSTSVWNFIIGRFTKKQKSVDQTEVIDEPEVTNEPRNPAEDAEPTEVLLSAPQGHSICKVLYNGNGTLKGKPYRKQEDIRMIKVSDFTEAYLMFCSFGNQESVTSKNHGGYELCAIDNSKEGLHFEMLVKPRRYPANTIATMTVISMTGFNIPIRTIYFVKTDKR